jgi:hypothetical protein
VVGERHFSFLFAFHRVWGRCNWVLIVKLDPGIQCVFDIIIFVEVWVFLGNGRLHKEVLNQRCG